MNKLTRFFFLLLFCILTINTLNTASQAMTDENPNKANGVICFKDGKPFPRREISVNDILKPNNPYTCGFKLNGKITYPPSKTYFQGQDYSGTWWIQTNDEGKEITQPPNLEQLYGTVYRSDMLDIGSGKIITQKFEGKLYWYPFEREGKSYESTFLQTSPTEKVKSGLLYGEPLTTEYGRVYTILKFKWLQVITERFVLKEKYNNSELVAFTNENPSWKNNEQIDIGGSNKSIVNFPDYTMTYEKQHYQAPIYSGLNRLSGHSFRFQVAIKAKPELFKNRRFDIVLAKNNYLILVEDGRGKEPFLQKTYNDIVGITPLRFLWITTLPLRFEYEIYDIKTGNLLKKGYKTGIRHYDVWSAPAPLDVRTDMFFEAINSTDPNEDLFKGIAKTTRR